MASGENDRSFEGEAALFELLPRVALDLLPIRARRCIRMRFHPSNEIKEPPLHAMTGIG